MITRRNLLALAALLAPLALAACETPPSAKSAPTMSFAHQAPFNLAVAQIDVTSSYKSPLKEPNVEHLMSPVPSPEAAARIWAKDRLKAAGNGDFRAEMRILNAPVIETSLKTDKGFSGMFKKEQSARYDAALAVEIVIRDGRGMAVASAEAKATRSQTVGEEVSLNQRDQIWFEMIEALMKDINIRLEDNIRTYMASYLR